MLWLALAVLGLGAAPQQEAVWQPSYAAARREAALLDKPILLVFHTDNCVWCDVLDQTTLRDPEVVTLLNERFVAYKAGPKDVAMAEALHLKAYPSLVLANSGGQVLEKHSGYVGPADMLARLRRVTK